MSAAIPINTESKYHTPEDGLPISFINLKKQFPPVRIEGDTDLIVEEFLQKGEVLPVNLTSYIVANNFADVQAKSRNSYLQDIDINFCLVNEVFLLLFLMENCRLEKAFFRSADTIEKPKRRNKVNTLIRTTKAYYDFLNKKFGVTDTAILDIPHMKELEVYDV